MMVEGFQVQRVAWEPCENAAPTQCASIDVPLIWNQPQGGMLSLRLKKIPARNHGFHTLLINFGGPGASGTELLSSSPFSSAVLDSFDLVSWDPRGVSDGVTSGCRQQDLDAHFDNDFNPDSPEERAALAATAQVIATSCAVGAEAVASLTTIDTVHDVEAIRVALGLDSFDFYGLSYGTDLAQALLARSPEHLRTVIFDGVMLNSDSLTQQLTKQAVAFEENLNSACVRYGCGQDPAPLAAEVMSKAEHGELNGRHGLVTQTDVATAGIIAAYRPGGWRDYVRDLKAANDGDPTALETAASHYPPVAGVGAYYGTSCTDSPHPTGAGDWDRFAQELASLAPTFGSAVAYDMEPCAFWPLPAFRSREDGHTDERVPKLVIGNTFDSATPFRNAKDLASKMHHISLTTLESDGHTSLGTSPCVSDVIEKFLTSAEVQPETSCNDVSG